jgi:phosphohistidine swiveling domain-containing protein
MKAQTSNELRTLNDGDEWTLAEDLPDMDIFFAQIWTRAFVNDLKNTTGTNYRKVMSIFHGMRDDFYYGEKDSLRFTMHLFSKIEKNPKFGDEINEGIKKRSDALVKQTEKFWGKDLSKESNRQLWGYLEESNKIHRWLYEYGWLSNATDMFHPLFTNKLREYLESRCRNEEEVSSHFITLTAPEEETVAMQETRSFLNIAMKIQNDEYHRKLFSKGKDLRKGCRGEIKRLIKEHWRKFVHLKFMYHGTTESMAAEPYYERFAIYFNGISILPDVLPEDLDPSGEIAKIESDFKSNIDKKEKLFKKLKIDSYYRHLFHIFSEFMVTKWYRRNAQILTFYHLDPVFREIGKRNKLKPNEVRFMLPEEIKEMLLNGPVDKAEIKRRTEFCVLYTELGKEYICTGEEAKKLENLIKVKIHGDVSELKGQCACLGHAIGKVKIIQGAKDMHKMQTGDILVAYATDPDVVPAMKKAAAIVTEQGGVTCHAAIVAREMKIPCVIGTKIATKVLRDGDLVEVNADLGIVKVIKRA